MRKTTILVFVLVMLGFSLPSCRRHKIIPDDVLVEIIHDVFITNAYISVSTVCPDSLVIYEPIFRKYGYTGADIKETIKNFSTRKSASLGNVIEKAESMIEEEDNYFSRQIVILDTIKSAATRLLKSTLKEAKEINVKSVRDTTLLKFEFDDIRPGDFQISFSYTCTENTTLNPRRLSVYLEKNNGGVKSILSSRVRAEDSLERSFSSDSTHRKLVVYLGEYEDQKRRDKKPGLKIKDLKILYSPSEQTASDSLFGMWAQPRIFCDEFLPEKSGSTQADK